MNAKKYLYKVREALSISLGQSNLYRGRDGALRLAREIGYCLKDYPDEEAYQAFRDSYTYVCVMGYNRRPPVDKKEWDREVLIGLRKGKY